VGVKLGPTATAEETVALCGRLDPQRRPGRLVLIARLGAERVRDALPPLVRAVRGAGHPVVWACDPMHGNTFTSPNGYKTRNFEDVMDLTRQAEEGLVAKGIKAEDSRYLRPNAATTNIVMSMSPRQLIHFFNLRCAPDAQWEIRDLAWSMYAAVRLASPQVFGPLPAADESEYIKKRVLLVEDLVRKGEDGFSRTPPGELFQLELQPVLELVHPVETFVRRY